MGFIRVKEIGKNGKKYRYAYLVENKWRKRLKEGKKGSRQKVSKYLGKVIVLDKIAGKDFFLTLGIANIDEYLQKSKAELVTDLVRYELLQRGFVQKENELMLEDEGLAFNLDLRKLTLFDEDKVVIEMNEGFLCSHTISRLVNFKAEDDDEHIIGIKLAKSFLEAGLNVPKEIFIGYFTKV